MSTPRRSLLVVSALVFAACGTSTDKGTGGTPTPTSTPVLTPTPTPDPYTNTTIHQVQDKTVTAAKVRITGAIVTAVEPVSTGVSFFAQDVGGGQYSGVLFWDQSGKTPAALAVGDQVTVEGTHQDYAGTPSSPWTRPQTEIIPDTVTIISHGKPTTVDHLPSPAALSDAAGDPWEGCLIDLPRLSVASVGVGYGEYSVSDTAGNYVRVDHGVADTFEPRLLGESISLLTGVVENAFDHYHVEPRSSKDVEGSASNTPAALSVSDLQDPTSAKHPVEGQLVTLSGVVVSGTAPWTDPASSKTLRHFWISGAAQAAPLQGIFVEDLYYTNPGVTPGDTVTVTGKYVEHGRGASGLGTDLAGEVILFPDAPVGTPTAQGVTVSPLLLDLATLKGSGTDSYDGVLVQLSDPSVTVTSMNPDAPKDYGDYTVSNQGGTASVRIGPLAYQTRATVGSSMSLSLVRGPFHKVAGIWMIEPRDAGDIAR